ncbi:leucine Rich Repeat [Seminavis robusta]|uniref:Leucine Rich Repeat n=1 Tax=Seminavis robusta TaxID=568900 RepID=A0A9N8H9T4_9STRA|nr:leucine Rich Repeat [Seminavis robusta]|eukprot:Sro291_g109480.1 leucine Rich Repeat (534) ;mRNA; r:44577-46610
MEDQFRPDGIMEKDAPLQPPATTPGIQHMGGCDPNNESTNSTDPLQPLEIDLEMPNARLVEDRVVNTPLEQYAVPVEQQSKATGGSGSSKLPLIYIIVALLVVIGVILAGVCGSGNCSSSQGSSMDGPSPRDMEGMEIKAQLEKTFGPIYFGGSSTDNTEPHQTALDWIIQEDPQQLAPDSNHLLQRFILAVFYFSTSQKSPWNYCGAGGRDFCYYKILQQHEVRGEPWLSDISECEWAGNSCQGETENITGVDMFGNGLSGPIPSELGLLPNLETIRLRKQNLTGTIPSTLLQLTSLESLSLDEGMLTGTIPSGLYSLPSLQRINLYSNKFTGTIPTEVGLFQGYQFSLSRNQITGTIPPELFSAKTNLRFVSLGHNQITGTIPTEIGLLPGVEGGIPEEIFLGCPKLISLDLESCSLSGTLSSNMGLLERLWALKLANNNFEGSIPEELGALTKLKHFTTNGNPELRGSIPDGICFENLNNPRGFDVVADCAPTTDTASDGSTITGEPLVSCPQRCCSVCCDAGTGICLEQ